MSEFTGRPGGALPRLRGTRRRKSFPLAALSGVALAFAGYAAWLNWGDPLPTAATPVVTASSAPPAAYQPLLNPQFALGPAPLPLGRQAPLSSALQSTRPVAPVPVSPLAALPQQTLPPQTLPPQTLPSQTLPLPVLAESERLAELMPLPVPRPADLRAPAVLPPAPVAPAARIATPASPRRGKVAAAPVASADDRSFFEKLFGVQRGPTTALAYAAPQDDVVDAGRGRRLSPAMPSTMTASARTAIYDISARMVYMPNGDRLEAHSGLGDKMDDPRFVNVRMQGATPPHTYDLTEREALFHGVRALRLNPVGGSGAIHGRAGLLTHTYLLGPNGDSNGCVSFKDYDRFLQAYLRGEVKRLVVVARM